MFRMYSELCNSHATRNDQSNLSELVVTNAAARVAACPSPLTLARPARVSPFAPARERIATSARTSSSAARRASLSGRLGRPRSRAVALDATFRATSRRTSRSRARDRWRASTSWVTVGTSSSDDEGEDEGRASVQLPRTRRRVQMTFTCNKCEGRTMRMTQP